MVKGSGLMNFGVFKGLFACAFLSLYVFFFSFWLILDVDNSLPKLSVREIVR